MTAMPATAEKIVPEETVASLFGPEIVLPSQFTEQAVVLARETASSDAASGGEKRLVAYVTRAVPIQELQVEDLRRHLRAVLPEYMVPGAYVVLDSLPLTSNGKVDRKALPAPELEAYGVKEYEPPQGEIEEILAGIWQELLQVERVGRQDNFFELGGHSLLIVQMIERLRRVYDDQQTRSADLRPCGGTPRWIPPPSTSSRSFSRAGSSGVCPIH